MLFKPTTLTGNTLTGTLNSVLGTITNLRFEPTVFDSGVLFWVYDGVNTDEIQIVIYLNGRPIKVCNTTETETPISGLQLYNRIEVKPMPINADLEFDYGDWNGGTEVFLQWSRCLDKDLKSYDIYYALHGQPTTNLLKSVTTKYIDKQIKINGTNTKSGTINLYGSYNSAININANYTITITNTGTFEFKLLDDTIISEFKKYDRINLQNGIIVEFNNDPADYDTNSVFTGFIGTINYYESQTLPQAIYDFRIVAVKENGNVSNNEILLSASVAYPPPTIVGDFEIDRDTNDLTFWWVNPTTNFQKVELYSNYDPFTHQVNDNIDYFAPVLSGTGTTYVIDIDDFVNSGIPTTFKFNIKNYDLYNRVNDSLIEYSITIPTAYNIDNLSTPSNLRAVNNGNYNYTLSWDYFYAENDICSEFWLYFGTTPENINLYDIHEAAGGFGFATQSLQHNLQDYVGGDVYLQIVATDTSINKKYSEILMLHVDEKSPLLPAGGFAVPN